MSKHGRLIRFLWRWEHEPKGTSADGKEIAVVYQMVRWLLHGPSNGKVREAVNWLFYSVLGSDKGSIDQKEGWKLGRDIRNVDNCLMGLFGWCFSKQQSLSR